MSTTVFAHKTLSEPPALGLERIEVDGSAPSRDVLDPGFLVARFDRLEEEGWRSVRLTVSVAAPPDQLAELERGGATEISACVVAFGRSTDSRNSSRLERSAEDPSRWTGTVDLNRLLFRGKVTLYAVIAGNVAGSAARWLGESHHWALYIDEPEVPPIEGVLRVKWTSFKGPERNQNIPELAEDETFYVALLEDPPIVYLNKEFPGLPDLLSDDASRPAPEKALRDAEFHRIAAAAWIEMFSTAVVSIDYDEESGEADWPDGEWKRSALRSLLPDIYPTAGDFEALSQAYVEFRGDGAPHLQGMVQVAISRQINASKSLKRNIDRIFP